MLRDIIEKNEITFILEDTGLKDKMQIINAHTSIEGILRILKNHHSNVIVISRKDKREHIFEIAMRINMLINFESITKYRTENIDISMFDRKIVIFDKSFDGTTSTTNNTYKNIKKIIDISEKFIAIDTIGANYLIPEYFPATLELFKDNFEFNYSKINDIQYMNSLLIENFIITRNNNMIHKIDINYWSNGYAPVINNNVKSASNKNEVSVQYGWAGNKYNRKSKKQVIDLSKNDKKDSSDDNIIRAIRFIVFFIFALLIIKMIGFFNVLGFILFLFILKKLFSR